MKAKEQRVRCQIHAFHSWFEPTMKEMHVTDGYLLYSAGYVYLKHYSILSYLVVWEAMSLFSQQLSFSFISLTKSCPFSVHHYRRSRSRQRTWLLLWESQLWITQCYIYTQIMYIVFLPTPKNHILKLAFSFSIFNVHTSSKYSSFEIFINTFKSTN